MLAACGLFDISQAGLWFYTTSVDFELSSLVCVGRNPEALASWNPLGLPMTPFSLLSLTVSRSGGASLTITTVDSYFSNTSNEAMESSWLVTGLHALCVISWPEMGQASEGRGVKACWGFPAEPHPLCWAMSRFPGYLTDSLTWQSVSEICPHRSLLSPGAPFSIMFILSKNNFWLCRFFFIVCLVFYFIDFCSLISF